jgi:hypothetical protein
MLYHDSTVVSNAAILPVYTFSSPSPYSSPSSTSESEHDPLEQSRSDDLDELFGGDTILVDGNHLNDIEKWSPPKNTFYFPTSEYAVSQVPDSRYEAFILLHY